MSALSSSQSMGLLPVISGEAKTVWTVMASRFPFNPAAMPTHLCFAPHYRIHPGPWNPSPFLHNAFEASGCRSICLQQELCRLCCVVSRNRTRLHRRQILQRFFQLELLDYFYGDIVPSRAWRVHMGFVRTALQEAHQQRR